MPMRRTTITSNARAGGRLWCQQIQDWLIAAVQNITLLCRGTGSGIPTALPKTPKNRAAGDRGQYPRYRSVRSSPRITQISTDDRVRVAVDQRSSSFSRIASGGIGSHRSSEFSDKVEPKMGGPCSPNTSLHRHPPAQPSAGGFSPIRSYRLVHGRACAA